MNFRIKKTSLPQTNNMEFPELKSSANKEEIKEEKKILNFAALDFSQKIEKKTILIASNANEEDPNVRFDEEFNTILIKMAENWRKHKQHYVEFHGLDEYNKTYLMPIDDY